jgi:hypothetical protein
MSAMSDILIYIVVLNIFVEYVESVIIDSFTISVLTAILIWLLLQTVISIEHRISSYFRQKESVIYHALGYFIVFVILFGSKFLILFAVEWVFLGKAALGHFIEIIFLVLAMMAAKALVKQIYKALGD